MNLDLELDANSGDRWRSKNAPQIEITFDGDGNVGLWVKDGPNGLVVCWAEMPPCVIRTLAAVAATWPLQPEEPDLRRPRR